MYMSVFHRHFLSPNTQFTPDDKLFYSTPLHGKFTIPHFGSCAAASPGLHRKTETTLQVSALERPLVAVDMFWRPAAHPRPLKLTARRLVKFEAETAKYTILCESLLLLLPSTGSLHDKLDAYSARSPRLSARSAPYLGKGKPHCNTHSLLAWVCWCVEAQDALKSPPTRYARIRS